MAKYNREFLVPYLHDICALYMTQWLLSERIRQREQQIKYYKTKIAEPMPDEPEYHLHQEESLAIGVIKIIGVLIILGSLFCPKGLRLLIAIMGLILTGGTVLAQREEKRKISEEKIAASKKYNAEMEEYLKKYELIEKEKQQKSKQLL